MEHFYNFLPGENWFDYLELYGEVVTSASNGAHFVEVGTWKGRSACYMAVEIVNSGKQIRFDCVDTWKPIITEKAIPVERYEELYSAFLKNISPVAAYINPVQAISWEAAELYPDESLDFVFIDAAHDYESVKKDIAAWYPKVKRTGIIAGHDYHNSVGVASAVHEFFKGRHAVIDKNPCWYVSRKDSLFSVVVPTMWKSGTTRTLLESLEDCTAVGEIFIINNSLETVPDYLEKLSKVTLYSSEKNNYVNPSWNIGVKNCKYGLVALCNDDIIFNPNIFKYLTIQDDTLIGLDASCYSLDTDSEKLQITSVNHRNYGFGCLMCFKKKDYKAIPEQLKIWYGDDYLFSTFKNTFALCGVAVNTSMSTTSKSSEFTAIIEQDKSVYAALDRIKLIDCFLYNGEARMLAFRLEELYSVVDYFVIVESLYTFKGTPKELKFNIQDYQKFRDKIIFIPCDIPPVMDAWQNETNQRRHLKTGLTNLSLKSTDLLLLSDVDEIPDTRELQNYKLNGLIRAAVFNQNFYYYNYNCRNVKKWPGSVLLNLEVFKNEFCSDFELVRKSRHDLPKIGNDYNSGGWHFSYFGDIDYIVNKIQEFSHQEYNDSKYTNRDSIIKLMLAGKDLFLRPDEKFERVENQQYLPNSISLLSDEKAIADNLTFIVAVQLDCADRLDNLDITLNAIRQKFPSSQTILLEADLSDKLSGRYSWISHFFIKLEPFELFNKMKLYNQGAQLATNKVLCFVDVDVLPGGSAVSQACKLITENIYDVVYPYGVSEGYDIPKQLHAKVASDVDVFNYDEKKHPWLLKEYRIPYVESGGLIVCSRASYFSVGGGNENFTGWGCEDDEMLHRFAALGYRIGRLDEAILLHLRHRRWANPGWHDFAKYEAANRERLAHVKSMTKEQLLEMTQAWNNFKKTEKDLTVIISGSYLDSHPSITFMREVVESLELTGIPHSAPLILAHDKIKPGIEGFVEKEKAYQEYFNNLEEYAKSSKFKNITISQAPEWGHLTRTLKHAVSQVKTKYMLVLQHDIHIRREIPVMKMIDLMEKHEHIKHLRFNVRRNHPTFMWWDGYQGGKTLFNEEEYDGVKLCVTPAWSDQNHLATKEYYETVVFPDCTNPDGELIWDFMENRMNGLCHHNHSRYGTYIYGEYGAPRTSRHSDGRKSSPEPDED
jgi:beta-1,4-mannosyl-glycoprotein beta-1,4-N-acetylglucosaminyltransferase